MCFDLFMVGWRRVGVITAYCHAWVSSRTSDTSLSFSSLDMHSCFPVSHESITLNGKLMQSEHVCFCTRMFNIFIAYRHEFAVSTFYTFKPHVFNSALNQCGGEILLSRNLDRSVPPNNSETKLGPICLITKLSKGQNSYCRSIFLTPCLLFSQLHSALWVVKNGKQMFRRQLSYAQGV